MEHDFDSGDGIIKLFYKPSEKLGEKKNETEDDAEYKSVKELCDSASEAFEEENFEKAVALWGEAAERGDAHAEYCLGVCCDRGLGVEHSASVAAEWYARSADKGYAQAQYNYAVCFECGSEIGRAHV